MSAIPRSIREKAEKADELIKNNAEPNLEGQVDTPEEETPQAIEDSPEQASEAIANPDPEHQQPETDYKDLFEKEVHKNKVLQGMIKKGNGERDRKISEQKKKIEELKSSSSSGDDSKLNAEIIALRDQVSGLTAQLARKPESSSETPQSASVDEDKIRLEYGDDLADVFAAQNRQIADLKKQFSSTVDPLTERVTRNETDFHDRVESERKYEEISRLLSEEGIDFWNIDADEDFINYLAYVDPKIGRPQQALLQEAWQAGDINRAAEFYREYHAISAHPEPSDPSTSLSQHITPEPNSSESPEGSIQTPRMFTGEDIDRFYAELRAAQRSGNRKEIERLTKLEQQIFHQQ